MATIAPARIPIELKHRIEWSVQWLLSRQREEGYWGEESPWLTGVVVWSLAKSTVHIENKQVQTKSNLAISKGVNWLESCQTQGGWDVEVGTWDTAIIVRALIAAGKLDSPACQRALDYLEGQGRNWFGKTKVGYGEGYPAQTLLALIEGGRDGFKYVWILGILRQAQNPDDGSWEDHLSSPEILEAISTAEGKQTDWEIGYENKKSKGGISRAITWIEKTQSKYGHWGGYTWHTATTLRSYLLAAQNPDGTVISKALSWLLNQQHPVNGSWFHEISLTAFSVLVLSDLLERRDILAKITPPILGPGEPLKFVRKPKLAFPISYIALGVVTFLCILFFDLFMIEHLSLSVSTILQLIGVEATIAGVVLAATRFFSK